MTEEVTLRFDPRRDQVHSVMAAAMVDQDETLIEQGVADAIMAACILGEVAGVDSHQDYFNMILAALPNARKAAAHHATTNTTI